MAFGEDGCDSYWSSKWRFITEGDLPAPITYTPPNGATGYITTPTFEWEGNIAQLLITYRYRVMQTLPVL